MMSFSNKYGSFILCLECDNIVIPCWCAYSLDTLTLDTFPRPISDCVELAVLGHLPRNIA